MSTITADVTVAKKSPEERQELLARAVANEIRHGWRVESQTDYQAVIVTGSGPTMSCT